MAGPQHQGMVFAMLKTRLIRDQDAKLHFEVMAWLIQTYGSPPRPPVPSPLHKTPGIESLAWEDLDTRSIFDWAEDNFNTIKSECHMQDWPIDLIPAGDGLDQTQVAASLRLDALAAGRNPYVTQGRAEIYYDPRDCVEPGYFTAHAVLQLAEFRCADFQSEHGLSPLMKRMVTLVSAAYCRQGFTLANLPHDVSKFMTSQSDLRSVPQRIVQNSLCFATCLGLRIRRQSAEQIIATYGTRMPKTFRRKVHQACKQVDSHAEDLAVLQMLAEPRARRAPHQMQTTAMRA